MASWIEIDRIRKDPAGFKSLARALLINSTFEKTEWEQDFLKDKVEGKKRQEFTTRQGETILDLRDKATLHTKYTGLSIPILIEKCWLNRFNLDERYVQKQLGHASAEMTRRYQRRRDRFRVNLTKAAGL